MWFDGWQDRKPVVGVVHLRALPGAPAFAGDLDAVLIAALRDADALAEGGVDGLIVENFGDAPFHPGRVPPVTVAAVTAIAREVRRRHEIPLGVNVLRNDGVAALAVAVACGARFIRVNVLCGARVTDQGIVQGIAHDLLRERARLRAEGIRILADVNVKHSAPLGAYDPDGEVEDALRRGGADGVIVSGTGTGKPVDDAELRRVKSAAGPAPVWIGSGVTAESASSLAPLADGFIVGTAFKRDGRVDAPVEPERVRALVARLRTGTA